MKHQPVTAFAVPKPMADSGDRARTEAQLFFDLPIRLAGMQRFGDLPAGYDHPDLILRHEIADKSSRFRNRSQLQHSPQQVVSLTIPKLARGFSAALVVLLSDHTQESSAVLW